MKEKKIPTILGLVILLAGIIGGSFLSRRTAIFRSRADTDCSPVNPQITNITHQAFDLSFTTAAICSSSLTVAGHLHPGPENSQTHYFQINGLEADTDYSLVVTSGGRDYQGGSYQVKTAATPSTAVPNSNLAWGKILNPDGSPASSGIVYVIIPGAVPLSAKITVNGNWNIPLATSFNSAKNNWFTPPDNIQEDIVVISADGTATQVLGNTSRNNPVPDITIGQNLSLAQPTSADYGTGIITSVPTVPASTSFSLISPQANEVINNSLPEIFGTGAPGGQITLEINPSSTSRQIIVDTNGSWRFSPTQPLSVGSYTLSLTYKANTSSTSESLTRQFSISTQSSGLAYTASASATRIPSPTITTATTPIPTSTSIPTIRSQKPSTSSAVPVTGNGFPTIFLLLLSTAFIILGLGSI